jgi:hypothetical protein
VNAPRIEQDLAIAQQFHDRGNLAAAELICRNIFDADPREGGALQLTGIAVGASECANMSVREERSTVERARRHALVKFWQTTKFATSEPIQEGLGQLCIQFGASMAILTPAPIERDD